jgi:UDP-3-O-[3-hydroxymyristoyl] N-acetylglucosamine deacetylase
VGSRLRTVLGAGGVTVDTVEHLMAALAALGVDNAIVDVDGPEVPALDGSALPFVELIDRAGIARQPASRRVLRVLRTVRVEAPGGVASLQPADGLVIDVELTHPGTRLAGQRATLTVTPSTFRSLIAPARTYGFLDDVAALRAGGFALGGSLDNAIVVSGESIVNPEGLRFADEPVRHKILDAIGDLALAGATVLGHFIGRGSGHALNHAVLAALLADPHAWALESGLPEAGSGLAQVGVPAE